MLAPLQLIPADAFDTRVPTPQYSTDFASIVGNAADNSDGFESLFSAMAAHVDDGTALDTNIGGALADLGGTVPTLSTSLESDATASLSDAIQNGQPAFDTVDKLSGPAQGRVWSGVQLAELAARAPQIFAPHVTAKPDVGGAEALFGSIPEHLNGPAWPVKIAYLNPQGIPALAPAKVELIGGAPVFERVWFDNLASSTTGTPFNIYVDINPLQIGEFHCTVRITETNGAKHEMDLQFTVVR